MKFRSPSYLSVWMRGSAVYCIDQQVVLNKLVVLKSDSFTDTILLILNKNIQGKNSVLLAICYAYCQFLIENKSNLHEKLELEYCDYLYQFSFFKVFHFKNIISKINQMAFPSGNPIENAIKESVFVSEEIVNFNKQIGLEFTELNSNCVFCLSECGLTQVDCGLGTSILYQYFLTEKASPVRVMIHGDFCDLIRCELDHNLVEYAEVSVFKEDDLLIMDDSFVFQVEPIKNKTILISSWDV